MRTKPKELSLADIADAGLEASHLSQHLSVLRRHNLVTAERRAGQVFYRLAHPEVAGLLSVARAPLVRVLETTHSQLVSTVSLPVAVDLATTEDHELIR